MLLPTLALTALLTTLTTSTPTKRNTQASPSSDCLTVGSNQQYSDITSALNALSSSSDAACIYITAGTYEEQLTIDYPGQLTIYGETDDSSSYKGNTVTITHTISSQEAGTLDKSATVNVVADGFTMYNVNVENGFGEGTQAVA